MTKNEEILQIEEELHKIVMKTQSNHWEGERKWMKIHEEEKKMWWTQRKMLVRYVTTSLEEGNVSYLNSNASIYFLVSKTSPIFTAIYVEMISNECDRN